MASASPCIAHCRSARCNVCLHTPVSFLPQNRARNTTRNSASRFLRRAHSAGNSRASLISIHAWDRRYRTRGRRAWTRQPALCTCGIGAGCRVCRETVSGTRATADCARKHCDWWLSWPGRAGASAAAAADCPTGCPVNGGSKNRKRLQTLTQRDRPE